MEETEKKVSPEETVETEQPAAEPKKEKSAPKKKKKNEWEEKFNAEHEQYLRLYAEFDNFRKRTARERDRLVGDGVAKAVNAILPAIDNLERAIAAAGESEGSLKSGVEMTMRQLLDSLKNIGVTPMGEKGEIFDPNRHEAMMHIDDPEYKEGEIVEVFQRGYIYKEETVIRHACVKTAN
ncbi:MAG: nucleotide exchange factor GrpE [Clostridia bacterium]|nr:nucleotide exchange factor GrpE [Clostridia bacterium]MBQ7089852.1 nucleotide exchange factor GrpE [Clostridia bacterium]